MAILKPVTTSARYLAVALGLCSGVTTLGHAQTVADVLTTGATIPESQPLSSALPTERSQTIDFGASLGIGETDNVFDTPSDHRAQTMAIAGIDFGWIRTGSALDANVVGNFNYLDYLQHAYSSQLLGRFDGLTSLSLFSDHLKWLLQDDFGEGQLDPYAPATPTNLEHINSLTTGPELTLRPLSDTVVQLGARYSLSTYETSPLDGYRLTENVLLERLLSSNSNIALGADLEQLRFDNTIVNTDYDVSRFYFRYDITGARTHITATVGETQANDGGEWIATPLVLFSLSHELSAQTSLNLSGGRELTDAGDTFSGLRSGAAGGIPVAAAAQTSGDFLRNFVTAGLQLKGDRTTIGMTANWERDTYTVDNTFDVTNGSVELRLNRQLSNFLSAGVFGALQQSRYFNQDGEINSRIIGANVTWRASRTLSVDGRYMHNFQGTSGGGFGYSANSFFVTVSYRPLQSGEQPDRQP
jgi:hypothetical protein